MQFNLLLISLVFTSSNWIYSLGFLFLFVPALTFNDEQFHLLEKMKMKETAKSLETLLAFVTATLHHATDTLADWCK